MTWPFHQTLPGHDALLRREAKDDDYIGGHMAGVETTNYGVIAQSQKLLLTEAEACPTCGMPMGACTTAEHDRTAPLLTGHDELMAQNAARRGPNRPTTTRAQRTRPSEDLPAGPVDIIATGEENASFTTAQVNQPVENAVITGATAAVATAGDSGTGDAAVNTTEVVSEVAVVPSPVLVTAVKELTDESRTRIPGEPKGYVVDPGQSLKGMPVRRVEGSNDIVQTREDVWVRADITGSKRKTYTLLLAMGTDIPMAQLDSTAP